MAKYNVEQGTWVLVHETTGSIQNIGKVPIEVSAINEENTGLVLIPNQIISFDGNVYVRSVAESNAVFTTVPFKITGKGGGSGGSGTQYILPTMSATVKGGAKLGSGLSIANGVLSVKPELAPTAKVEQTANGAIIKMTDTKGTTQATVLNGTNGAKGTDGYSPTIGLQNIDNGYRVTVNDKNGTQSFSLVNGANGKNGISPTINASKSGNISTLVISDVNGVSRVNIKDGVDGKNGIDGKDGVN